MNPKGTSVTCRAIQVFYHDFNRKSKISINFNLNHSKISLQSPKILLKRIKIIIEMS